MSRWNGNDAGQDLVSCGFSVHPVLADDVSEAFQDYTDFATYDAGVIRPDQLTSEIAAAVTFIDTQRVEEFDVLSIPGAKNIEWREIFGRADEIPTDQNVILLCNTAVLSAPAVFGLRVLSYENVLMLQGGFDA